MQDVTKTDEELKQMVTATREIQREGDKFGVFLIIIVEGREYSKKRMSPLFKVSNGATNWLEIYNKRLEKQKAKKENKDA